jgi:enoyl-CoA hydratase/carnithine racemase
MPFQDILVEKRDHVALITFNRPEKLNAFRAQTNLELLEALDEIEKDDDVHSVVLTGTGGGFCTGHDMSDPAEPPADRLGWNAQGRAYGRIIFKLLHLRQPVVAAINGWCVAGGVGIALACDILIASDDAQFYMPQIMYGYPSMPGVGALFAMYTSMAWTKDLILRRRKIDAATAERIGLITQVTPRAELLDEAWKAGRELAEVPPDIMMMQREMMNRIWMGVTGLEAAMLSGRHTAIAGHSLPDWEEREANWKTIKR